MSRLQPFQRSVLHSARSVRRQPAAMPFRVGQIVDMIDTALGLATVIEASRLMNFNLTVDRNALRVEVMAARILWHRDQSESLISDSRLRAYVNPMDRPGRVTGAYQTFQALSTIIQQEVPERVTR